MVVEEERYIPSSSGDNFVLSTLKKIRRLKPAPMMPTRIWIPEIEMVSALLNFRSLRSVHERTAFDLFFRAD
jgi:hypothetical protein